ncbi:hypothetical protein CHS0354_039876 [Potamilus streckersoni]|uniref:Uncharacterized protein n=1 Tax=Potamilus streckersoni TaxID=2493646 RepID=A0AAE0VWH1_9BIVA|nr:hypothetical protein CHS0354_039876 [Potamilus streckersoni]
MPTETADEIALEDSEELTPEKEISATWEHEDLATVRIKVIRGHSDAVNSCQYLRDDQRILTASSDRSIKLWTTDAGKLAHSFESAHSHIITEARATKDGKRFLSGSWDKSVKAWDTEAGKILWTGHHEGAVMCCKLSHDGKLAASGSDLDNTLIVWETDTGKIVHKIPGMHSSSITSCIFSPNDDKVCTTSMDRTAKFFDLKSCATTIKLGGHINVIADCDFSPDERKFATASWDKNIQVWDIATGTYRSKGPSTLHGSHEGSVSCCRFSNDGQMMVSGSYDQNIVVWDVDNMVEKVKLQGHTDWVEDVCFNKDDSWLLSCSKDHTIRMWNIEDSDKIPVVLEKRKAVGLKIIKCQNCGKPFSMAQLENFRDLTICVFCRLQAAEHTMVSITSNENL